MQKKYEKPKLITHGKIEEITKAKTDNMSSDGGGTHWIES